MGGLRDSGVKSSESGYPGKAAVGKEFLGHSREALLWEGEKDVRVPILQTWS